MGGAGGAAALYFGGLTCWVQAENVSSYSPFVPGNNAPPTAISLQSAGIRSGSVSWPLAAAAVLMLFMSAAILSRLRNITP